GGRCGREAGGGGGLASAAPRVADAAPAVVALGQVGRRPAVQHERDDVVRERRGALQPPEQATGGAVTVAPPPVGPGADDVHAVDHGPGHQFSDGCGGALANMASRPPWRPRTDAHSRSGWEVNTSSGAASTTNQPPASSSPSSCPSDQPA